MEFIRAAKQRIIRSSLNCFTSRSRPDEQFDFPPINKSPDSPRSIPKKTVRATTQETTLIIAHGAFQSQLHYQSYLDAVLQDTSITNVLVPHQTASGPDPPTDCFTRDVATIRAIIIEELTAGRDVVLLAHSYGGVPCCEALVNLPSITSTITPGRILGIIFVSAFVLETGQSLVSSHPFGRAAWVGSEGPLCHIIDPIPTLYNTLATTNPTLATQLVANLTSQSLSSFTAPLTRASWLDFPCVYVRCLRDQAMDLRHQDFFIEKLRKGKGGKKDVMVRELKCDHSPFASVPVELAGVTEDVVEELRAGLGE